MQTRRKQKLGHTTTLREYKFLFLKGERELIRQQQGPLTLHLATMKRLLGTLKYLRRWKSQKDRRLVDLLERPLREDLTGRYVFPSAHHLH